ncbi:MAG: ubiquinol-cytochrome c reductase iron-sulfur subunit [Myxococcales bacterium]|nr:ubiquinol-cytochrome c reductase iron-sulfur subunit [Myxococcales bacterium]
MALIDDLSADVGELDLKRRKLLAMVTSSTFAIAGFGTAITMVSYLRPNVLFEPPTKFSVGRPEEIPVGQLLVLPEQRIYVVHLAEGFVALNAACTHLGCMTRYEAADQRVSCPCHGSVFSLDGKVTDGPAPKPLERRMLELADGQLIVDVAAEAPEDFMLEV